MKEFIGDPEDKLMNLMDPANPMMSGVVQNQDSYMKGKIAQRWYYDRVGPGPRRRLRRVLSPDRPPLRLPRAVPLRGRRVHPRRHGLLHGDGRRRPSITCATSKGIAAGCLTVFVFRPFPATADRRGLARTARRSPSSSGWTTRSRPRATTSPARSRPPSATRSPARTATSRSTAIPADLQRRRPAWAAATSGPATSSPRSTT